MGKKYCTAGQATDDNTAHALFACWAQVYKHTQNMYVMLIVFPLQQRLHERASTQCYVIRTLSVLSHHNASHQTALHPGRRASLKAKYQPQQIEDSKLVELGYARSTLRK